MTRINNNTSSITFSIPPTTTTTTSSSSSSTTTTTKTPLLDLLLLLDTYHTTHTQSSVHFKDMLWNLHVARHFKENVPSVGGEQQVYTALDVREELRAQCRMVMEWKKQQDEEEEKEKKMTSSSFPWSLHFVKPTISVGLEEKMIPTPSMEISSSLAAATTTDTTSDTTTVMIQEDLPKRELPTLEMHTSEGLRRRIKHSDILIPKGEKQSEISPTTDKKNMWTEEYHPSENDKKNPEKDTMNRFQEEEKDIIDEEEEEEVKLLNMDPLYLFGALPPRALKIAQTKANKSLQSYVETANIVLNILLLLNRLENDKKMNSM